MSQSQKQQYQSNIDLLVVNNKLLSKGDPNTTSSIPTVYGTMSVHEAMTMIGIPNEEVTSQDDIGAMSNHGLPNGRGRSPWDNRCSRILNFEFGERFFNILLFICICGVVWLLCFVLTKSEALPGGSIFVLFVLLLGGIYLGKCFSLIHLPPMVGMLGLGLLIRNTPYIDFGKHLASQVSSPIRQIALAVILTRAGLGLNLEVLIRLKSVIISLALLPALFESIVVGLVSHFLLNFPWTWAIMFGFVASAVSPAVIVPRLLALKEEGYGMDKGIPIITIAAASLDNIFVISAFGTLLGITFSEGELVKIILQGPLEVTYGLLYGLVWGAFLGFFFQPRHKNNRNMNALRAVITFCGSVISVIGLYQLGYSGAGALGCLVSVFFAANLWKRRDVVSSNPEEPDILIWIFYVGWVMFEPLLFGVIGNQIDLIHLDLNTVLFGIICIIIGALVRFGATLLAVMRSDFNMKEKLFIAIAWIPKATVQAAIGPIALDTAMRLQSGPEMEKLGSQLLTLAVVVIILTAPLGELGVILTGTRFLSRQGKNNE